MGIELRDAVAIGLVATIALWGLVLWRRPEQRQLVPRGLGFAALASVVVGLAVALIATLATVGRPFLLSGSNLDLGQSLGVGATVGTIVGVGFFWLAAVALAVGLWFRGGPGFATWGAVLAVPVVVAALGFGYTALRAFESQQQQPVNRPGLATLALRGSKLGQIDARGAASCAINRDGSLSLDADLVADDGRSTYVALNMFDDESTPSVQIVVDGAAASPGKGWEPGPLTTKLAPGSNPESGAITLADLVPLTAQGDPEPTERWSGSLTWDCPSS